MYMNPFVSPCRRDILVEMGLLQRHCVPFHVKEVVAKMLQVNVAKRPDIADAFKLLERIVILHELKETMWAAASKQICSLREKALRQTACKNCEADRRIPHLKYSEQVRMQACIRVAAVRSF